MAATSLRPVQLSAWDDATHTLNVDGDLAVTGAASVSGLSLNTVAKTAAYTATAADDSITCGAGNETFTVDLPVLVEGKVYLIANIGSGVITIDANTTGGTTINGDNTYILNQNESAIVQAISGGIYWIF